MWLLLAHELWALGLAALALMGAGAGWFALAAAHAVAFVLVLTSRSSRYGSVVAARAVPWVSLPLLGAHLVVLVALMPRCLIWFNQAFDPFRTEPAIDVGPSVAILDLVLSIPTTGAFVAALICARGIRRA